MIKNKKVVSLLSVTFTVLMAADAVPQTQITGNAIVPHDKPYYKHKDTKNNLEIIYTENNIPSAKHTAEIESSLHND